MNTRMQGVLLVEPAGRGKGVSGWILNTIEFGRMSSHTFNPVGG